MKDMFKFSFFGITKGYRVINIVSHIKNNTCDKSYLENKRSTIDLVVMKFIQEQNLSTVIKSQRS